MLWIWFLIGITWILQPPIWFISNQIWRFKISIRFIITKCNSHNKYFLKFTNNDNMISSLLYSIKLLKTRRYQESGVVAKQRYPSEVIKTVKGSYRLFPEGGRVKSQCTNYKLWGIYHSYKRVRSLQLPQFQL